MNCLATIIQSLRDKVRCVPSGQQTSLTTVLKIEATPPLEDEDEVLGAINRQRLTANREQ
jgi:hypothetical protein